MKNQQDNASNDKYFLGINDGVVNSLPPNSEYLAACIEYRQ